MFYYLPLFKKKEGLKMVYLLELFSMNSGRSKVLRYKTLEQLQAAYFTYSHNTALVVCSAKVLNKATNKKTLIKV